MTDISGMAAVKVEIVEEGNGNHRNIGKAAYTLAMTAPVDEMAEILKAFNGR